MKPVIHPESPARPARLALLSLALVLAAPGAPAGAQRTDVGVDQLSTPAGAPPRLRGAATSTDAGLSGPRAAAVDPELAEACRRIRQLGAAPPAGMDCSAIDAEQGGGRRLSAESSLLGLARPGAPSGTARPGGPNVEEVARRVATGDVQDPSDTEAIGVIQQQGAAPQ